MKPEHYQRKAHSFAKYLSNTYPYIAIAEEAGEVAGLAAKALRKFGDIEEVNKTRLKKELGDVLWNVAEICTLNGWDLGEVMLENIEKLEDRDARDVIIGEGDFR